ncbi:MAG TPA: hypothetical protein VFL93_16275 [Longimicrobiaceae bacterium]|jgi:hypothetical protein|nr:hypothetical protein [Longimicrobiaceae bacterium]
MRKSAALLAGLLLAACSNNSAPPVYSAVGTWQSVGFAPADVQMTLVETARSPAGAGRWIMTDSAAAFRVTGAHVDTDISLLFDFDGRSDVSLAGVFRPGTGKDAPTQIAGALFGGGFSGDSIVFERLEDQPGS